MADKDTKTTADDGFTFSSTSEEAVGVAFGGPHMFPRLAGEDIGHLMVRGAETIEPELFRKLYPRRYAEIGGFHSAKVVAAFLTDAVASARWLDLENLPAATRLLLPGLKFLMEMKMPMMFLDPKLVEAVKRTDFPDAINWQEMHLPYEHGIFMLPKGTLVHPVDGEAVCIIYSRMPPGIYYPPEQGKLPRLEHTQGTFSFLALTTKNGVWYDGNLTDESSPLVKLNNLFYSIGEEYGHGPHLPTPTILDHKLNHEDSIFLESVATLMFGTFMVMDAKPELHEKAKLERKVKSKIGPPIEYWSPNVIGKYYKPKVIRTDHGTHASPRMHWRRGHTREQAHGPQRSLRKTIWIEPMLVSATAEEKDKHG